jgi:hypothetical protein
MKKTLVVLAHPGIEKRSIANKIIIKKIRALGSWALCEKMSAIHWNNHGGKREAS